MSSNCCLKTKTLSILLDQFSKDDLRQKKTSSPAKIQVSPTNLYTFCLPSQVTVRVPNSYIEGHKNSSILFRGGQILVRTWLHSLAYHQTNKEFKQLIQFHCQSRSIQNVRTVRTSFCIVLRNFTIASLLNQTKIRTISSANLIISGAFQRYRNLS